MPFNARAKAAILDGATSQAEPYGNRHSADDTNTKHSAGHRLLSTEELAAALGMNAQSIRKRYSQTGSYFQLRPIKLRNRRLLWPPDAVEQLIDR